MNNERNLTIRQLDKIDRMCAGAVGCAFRVNSKGGKSFKGTIIAAEFSGWRDRRATSIAQFKITMENPPCFPKRVIRDFIIEKLPH